MKPFWNKYNLAGKRVILFNTNADTVWSGTVNYLNYKASALNKWKRRRFVGYVR